MMESQRLHLWMFSMPCYCFCTNCLSRPVSKSCSLVSAHHCPWGSQRRLGREWGGCLCPAPVFLWSNSSLWTLFLLPCLGAELRTFPATQKHCGAGVWVRVDPLAQPNLTNLIYQPSSVEPHYFCDRRWTVALWAMSGRVTRVSRDTRTSVHVQFFHTYFKGLIFETPPLPHILIAFLWSLSPPPPLLFAFFRTTERLLFCSVAR